MFTQRLNHLLNPDKSRDIGVFGYIPRFLQVRQANRKELVRVQFFHVLEIDPVQFFNIEHCRILGYAIEREQLAKLFFTENFPITFGRPAQKREEIEESIRQISHVPILLHGSGAVTFAHLFLIRAENKRYVSKLGRLKAQQPVKHKLARRIGKMLFRTDNMCDFHKRVVKNYTIIINGDAVGFNDNEIADFIGIKRNFTANDVIDFKGLVPGRLNTNDIRPAFF